MSSLTIRPANLSLHDHEKLIDFWDSQIPWLSTVGSGDQWGTQSIKETRPEAGGRARAFVERSEAQTGWGPEWCRTFIAEVHQSQSTEDPDQAEQSNGTSKTTAVAGLVLEAKSAAYVRSVLPEQDGEEPFVYIAYLMSNRDAGELTKGAGSKLIDFAKEQVRELGLHRLCLDCWRGNVRKLVKYYESQGFVALGDFTAGEKEWPGCVLEMRL